jgi:hypothetical protein
VTLTIRRASDSADAAAIVFGFCGRVDISGAGAFAPSPFCYAFRLDDFPSAFPLTSLPSLDITPPDLGFRLPKGAGMCILQESCALCMVSPLDPGFCSARSSRPKRW